MHAKGAKGASAVLVLITAKHWPPTIRASSKKEATNEKL